MLFQLSIGMLVYLLFYAKKSALLYSYVFFHVMAILWVLHSILSITVTLYVKDINILIVFNRIIYGYLGIFIGGATGLSWLLFALNYVGWKYAQKAKYVLLICLPDSLLYIGLLTNQHHFLFFREDSTFGILYWIHAFVSYTASLIGFIVLANYARSREKYEKSRTLLLMTAYMIPLSYLLYQDVLSKIVPFRQILPHYISFAPFAFFVASALVTFTITKYRFLNITPIASNKIVENLSMAVLIVDSTHRVINMNRSFLENFSEDKRVGHNETIAFLNDFISRKMVDMPANYAALNAINSVSSNNYTGELILNTPTRKYYEVSVHPIVEKAGILGRIISFDDNTQIKTAMDQLEDQNNTLSYLNKQLIEKNDQLKYYAHTAEELAVVKERQRFSRDAHDTLGHTMTVLITQLKVAEILCKTNAEAAREKITESLLVAKEGLRELRKSIMGIAPGKLSEDNIKSSILNLINDYKSTGMKIDVTVNGDFESLPDDLIQALFRLLQEALTNSLRHGRATHVDIVMNSADSKLKVLIKDNGTGCKNINKGFGLKGMEQRISAFNGTVHYGSDGENGFNIFVEVPVYDKSSNSGRSGSDQGRPEVYTGAGQ